MIDPVSLALITALGAGVTNTITTATQATLAAGYRALKDCLLTKIGLTYPEVGHALAKLEAAPASQARQAVLVEEVTTAQVPQDPQLMTLAQALLEKIEQTPAGSQLIHHVQNSAISHSGAATTYNIQGDQHITSA
ncbi:MAG: hypothetical protein JO202_04810 [Ktedonobacteraceae bacterium]|nr:hypothetical protein [Ktedonobacteraceae bacterium]